MVEVKKKERLTAWFEANYFSIPFPSKISILPSPCGKLHDNVTVDQTQYNLDSHTLSYTILDNFYQIN